MTPISAAGGAAVATIEGMATHPSQVDRKWPASFKHLVGIGEQTLNSISIRNAAV